MAKETKAAAATAEPEKPKTGTERVLYVEGKWRVPSPQVEKPVQVAAKAPEKKADPHKPKDVQVTSAHVAAALAGSMAANRMTRLVELSRRNNDVKWLLGEYQNTHSKKTK